MANPTYSTQNIQSNVLVKELWKEYGFCREAAQDETGYKPLDNAADNIKLGTLVYDSGTAWDALTDAQVTSTAAKDAGGNDLSGSDFAIVIGTGKLGEALDTSQNDIDVTATASGLLLVRGAAIVRKEYLNGGTTGTAAVADLKTIIEANMSQVQVVDGASVFDGTYSDVTAIS